MKVQGVFNVQHYDAKGNLLKEYEFPNSVVDEGMNKLLEVMFRGTAALTTWFCGLIDNTSFSALAGTDVLASHTGWIEFVAYSESVRQTYTAAAVSGRACANSTQMTFTCNAAGTVKGLFIASNSTKSGVSGTLFSEAAFPGGNLSVGSGHEIKITYAISG